MSKVMQLTIKIEISPNMKMADVARELRALAMALSPLAVDPYTINGRADEGMIIKSTVPNRRGTYNGDVFGDHIGYAKLSLRP